jgi:hypothetical protein
MDKNDDTSKKTDINESIDKETDINELMKSVHEITKISENTIRLVNNVKLHEQSMCKGGKSSIIPLNKIMADIKKYVDSNDKESESEPKH